MAERVRSRSSDAVSVGDERATCDYNSFTRRRRGCCESKVARAEIVCSVPNLWCD